MKEMNKNLHDTDGNVQESSAVPKKKEKKERRLKIDFSDRKTKKLIKKIIIWVVIAAVLVGGYFFVMNTFVSNDETASKISTSTATRGDLEVTITGSGVMEAMEKYDIVPMVKGEILSAAFEEGDIVEKDSVLYVFDSSDAQISIQKAQNSITKAEITNRSNTQTLADWVSTAPVDGYISSLNVKVGDSVNANTPICTVTNDDIISVTIPFSSAYMDNIYVGAKAQLTSAEYMTSNIFGTVNDIDRTPIRSGDGEALYNVEIVLDNPGAISEGMSFTARIDGCTSAAAGTSEVYEQEQVSTKSSGKVVAVYYKNGDKVKAGDKIIAISNDTTLDSIEKSNIEYSDLQLSLQSQYDALDNYTIKSPIQGTVITKNYKAGDTIDNSNSSVNLAVVADMSKMKFTMDVDELDIAKIQLDQAVEVVADAYEGKTFAGRITNIIQEGESMNGVTVYPVEVVIDEPEDLMIGMNVTATVIVESKSDVLKVPVDAVASQGGKSYVMKLKDDKAPQRTEMQKPDASAPMPGGGEAMDGEMPRGEGAPDAQMPRNEGNRSQENGDRQSAPGGNVAAGEQNYTADDFERVEVEVGINSEDEIEIISGIDEGDIVRVTSSSSSSNNMMNMMGGMPGGMGGGMPGGGGMSGGNGGGMRGGGGGMPGGR